MTQYFSNVLRQPTSGLEVPDLQAMAKDNDLESTLLMCRLIVAIAVNCSKNEQFIANIQTLGQTDQQQLMRSIERVRMKLFPFL
jgi:protein HOOK3